MFQILKRILILWLACTAPVAAQPSGPTVQSLSATIFRSVPEPGSGPVQIIYVVPSDRIEKASYARELLGAVRHFQHWLATQLDGYTFRLAEPPIRTVRVAKSAAWFSGTHKHGGYIAFTRNTIDELQSLGVARYRDPTVRFLIVVDADLACGQSGTGGAGVAVVEANTFRGLSGEAIVPACATASRAEVPNRCRWVGGIGHELLHTMGLGHSDQFADCSAGACLNQALMKYGYVTYPDANLRPQEKDFLRASGFISRIALPGQVGQCARPSG